MMMAISAMQRASKNSVLLKLKPKILPKPFVTAGLTTLEGNEFPIFWGHNYVGNVATFSPILLGFFLCFFVGK